MCVFAHVPWHKCGVRRQHLASCFSVTVRPRAVTRVTLAGMEVTLPAEPSCQPSGIYWSFPATVLMLCAQIPPRFSSFIAIERVSEFCLPVCALLLCSSCGLASLTWRCHSLMRCSPRSPSPPFLVYILGNRFGGKEGT